MITKAKGRGERLEDATLLALRMKKNHSTGMTALLAAGNDKDTDSSLQPPKAVPCSQYFGLRLVNPFLYS